MFYAREETGRSGQRSIGGRKRGVGLAVAALPLEACCLDDTGHLLAAFLRLVQRTSIALRCGKRPKRWRMLRCLSAWVRSVSSRLGICPISDFRKEPDSRNLRGPPHQAKRGVRTMSRSGFETPEQVLRFDPKAKGRSDVNPLGDAGQAIVAQIERPPTSRTRTAIAPCRWPTNFRWSFERRKIERMNYGRKWNFGEPAQPAPKNGFEQFRKRSRTSSSFGDRYPVSKKQHFNNSSTVARGSIGASQWQPARAFPRKPRRALSR